MLLDSNALRARGLAMTASFILLANMMTGECIIGKPLRVHQVCGQVLNEKGFVWPGSLRLTKSNQNGPTDVSQQLVKTDDEGKFAFRDIPAGEYELRITPAGMREIFVPVLVELRRPQHGDACTRPIDLKISFLPEACVSPELRKQPR